jgi:hypothetical protein
VQPHNVILVILHRLQRHLRHQPRNAELDAVHLVHRHLPILEARVLHPLAQLAQHQRLVQDILLRQPRGVDRLKDADLGARMLNLPQLFRRRVVAPPVVVPRIADPRRQLRARAQRVLPLLFERFPQPSAARSDSGILSKNRSQQQEEAARKNRKGTANAGHFREELRSKVRMSRRAKGHTTEQ